MGLDKEHEAWLNKDMMKFIRIFTNLFPRLQRHEVRKSPLALEQERLMHEMKDQFLKLKEKGLGIAVFTL